MPMPVAVVAPVPSVPSPPRSSDVLPAPDIDTQERPQRSRPDVNYNEAKAQALGDELRWCRILEGKKFAADSFPRMRGHEFTADWIRHNGWAQPVVIVKPHGLGMQMPKASLKLFVLGFDPGQDRVVECLEVSTQAERLMTLGEWARYFAQPSEERRKIFNVISLEISGSPLADQIRRPQVVRDMDWLDIMWPHDSKHEYVPNAQLYCLMSAQNSYTDFHLDFGGTSVFYHILSGKKVFYFIAPTPANMRKYAKWSTSPDQHQRFFGDEIPSGCIKVQLEAGNTMFIPSGWIHAVFTPVDSVVIGGNFLHSLAITSQLEVTRIERETNVPRKFRFPNFAQVQWFAGTKFARQLHDIAEPDRRFSDLEIEQIQELVDHLDSELDGIDDGLEMPLTMTEIRRAMPPNIPEPRKLVERIRRGIIAQRRRPDRSPQRVIAPKHARQRSVSSSSAGSSDDDASTAESGSDDDASSAESGSDEESDADTMDEDGVDESRDVGDDSNAVNDAEYDTSVSSDDEAGLQGHDDQVGGVEAARNASVPGIQQGSSSTMVVREPTVISRVVQHASPASSDRQRAAPARRVLKRRRSPSQGQEHIVLDDEMPSAPAVQARSPVVTSHGGVGNSGAGKGHGDHAAAMTAADREAIEEMRALVATEKARAPTFDEYQMQLRIAMPVQLRESFHWLADGAQASVVADLAAELTPRYYNTRSRQVRR
nr:JmjC domain-containing histone demethylation protein 1 [Polyrhizophydium stewartii]